MSSSNAAFSHAFLPGPGILARSDSACESNSGSGAESSPSSSSILHLRILKPISVHDNQAAQITLCDSRGGDMVARFYLLPRNIILKGYRGGRAGLSTVITTGEPKRSSDIMVVILSLGISVIWHAKCCTDGQGIPVSQSCIEIGVPRDMSTGNHWDGWTGVGSRG